MSEQIPNPRRLAPDSKFILTTVVTVIIATTVGLFAVMQYQLSRMETALLRSNDQLREEARDRKMTLEQRLSRVDQDINGLREARATQAQRSDDFRGVADRLIDIALTTQQTAAESGGRLQELIAQSRANTEAIAKMAESQATLSQALTERLTAIETRVKVQTAPPR